MRTLHLLLIGLLAVGHGTDTRAGRPLVSETADALEQGACEIESALARTRANATPSVRETSVIFSCGVRGDTQPALGYARASGDGRRAETLLIGAKTTLKPPTERQLGFGLAYSVSALQTPGQSFSFEDLQIVALVTGEMARGLLGHANLGWNRKRSTQQHSTLWSIGFESVGDITLAGDFFGDDRNRPSVSAGLGYALGKNLSLNAAYAMQFDRPRVRQLSIGARVAF